MDKSQYCTVNFKSCVLYWFVGLVYNDTTFSCRGLNPFKNHNVVIDRINISSEITIWQRSQQVQIIRLIQTQWMRSGARLLNLPITTRYILVST